MTKSSDFLKLLSPLISDLSDQLPAELRFQRFLAAVRQLASCDAAALLRLDGDFLIPVSVSGLSVDAFGRGFSVEGHPRLRTIIEATGPVRFVADCGLPDPYDGLIGSAPQALGVHDCIGCALRVDSRVWGVLTLDALGTDRFGRLDMQQFAVLAALAAATMAAVANAERVAGSLALAGTQLETSSVPGGGGRPALVGRSPAFRRMIQEIDLVAPSDHAVLITGDTGAGKELVARRVHDRSSRSGNVFVSVNCAALRESLVESELFGHVRGAFSGAVGNRRGRFEIAHGGTLFLDEIGELPLGVQAKLLRVLQDGQLQRVGSDLDHQANVRVIAATNRDLAAEVRDGRFRADLYHRLGVNPLRVPSLAERGRDVLILAGTFIEQNRHRMGIPALRMTSAAQSALLAHSWPGNIRELEYLIARAVLRTHRRETADARLPVSSGILSIDAADLELQSDGQGAPPPGEAIHPAAGMNEMPSGLRAAVDALQRQLIICAIARHSGNAAAAARSLGLDRANLMRLAARLEIRIAARVDRRRGVAG